MHDDSTESGYLGGARADLPTFAADELVGGRYRIARFLGKGATGEVYAARDLELGTDVALKVLRSRDGAASSSIERFKREILLARRVSHPNVCRIFDLGVHLLERDGESRPALFLTMELLDGRTLVRRVEEEGPLPEAQALPIVRQLADALSAAHAVGVVHRDFKSSNILLVREDGGERAVITDFGLARDERQPSGTSGLTGAGGVLGTPAYMAPEQVEGRRATPRSDLYAFGVVLYEMLTGELPFEGESPLSVAVKRLHEDPIPIEERRADLSPRVRAVVRRCLERAPEDRFADAHEIPRALEGELSALAPRRRRRRWAAAAVALVALAGGWGLWRALAGSSAGRSAEAIRSERSSVAVLGLRNATGRAEAAWLSSALAEMLTTELAAGETVRAIPGETVARAVADLALSPADSLSAATLAKLRRVAGSQWVLLGSYTALGESAGGRLRLDLRLQRTDGDRDLPFSIEGSEGEIFELIGRAGRDLRGKLGVRESEAAPADPVRAAMPATEGAVRLYHQGLERLRSGEPLAARELLEGVVADDPDAPLPWAALAEAWSELGYADRALEAARSAWQRRSRLPRAEALAVEARYRVASHEWEPAIEIYRALWKFFPDDLDQGLVLADTLVDADRTQEALDLLPELRALGGPSGEDPRVDLVEARAAEGLSDFRLQLAAATRAAAKAEAIGSRSLQAKALHEIGVAQRKLGDAPASRAALLRSRALAAAVGDRAAVALTLQSLGTLERAEGRPQEAAALYAEARATFAALGNVQREARAELVQGLAVSALGDPTGALALYGSALEKLRRVGDRRGAAAALANLGTMLYELGDLERSLARQTEALAEFRALGDASRTVTSLQNLAQIHVDRAELAAAQAALDESLETTRRIGDRAGEGYALKALGDLAAERGDRGLARSRYQEALAVYGGAGQQMWVRVTEMALAVLARDDGRGAESERELARLTQEFERAGSNGDRDEAAVQRVRTLLAMDRRGDAEAAAAGVVTRAAGSDARRVRHLARLADAELALAGGDSARARRALEADLEESRRAGTLILALEARALLARAAASAGEPGASRRMAEALDEARRVGCGRLVERYGGDRLAADAAEQGRL